MGNKITQEELKILLENPVLIYGAGRGASRIILNLKALGANIVGIAVSDLSDDRTIGFGGFQIKTPEEYIAYKDSVVVLIATSEKYHDEIMANCRKLGFSKIITHSPDLTELTSDISHRKLFEKNGLPLDSEIITIGTGKYLNPYSSVISNKFGIVEQWEDICSTAFGDMSMSFLGPYEFDGVKISEGDIAFDIGASIGYISVYAVSKGAEAYAFEPCPANKPLIEKHSELNGNKIRFVPFAVADKSGQADFFFNPFTDAAGSLDAAVAGGGERISVRQVTIDEFINENGLKKVDYMHIDTVGSELLVLLGSQSILKEFTPKLVVDTSFCLGDKQKIINIIKEANPGYNIAQKCNRVYAWVK